MARIVQITVEFHGDPELPDYLAQTLLDEVIDAVNDIGYVSNVEWQAPRPLNYRDLPESERRALRAP